MFSRRYLNALTVLLVAVLTLAFQQPVDGQKNNSTTTQPSNKQQSNPPKPTPTPRLEPFWQKVLRITGISVTPSALKGEDDTLTGDIWLAEVGKWQTRRLTYDGGYRSPLVLPSEQAVWALKGETIYDKSLEVGPARERYTIKGIVKLAAIGTEKPAQVLLLREDEAHQTIVELVSVADGKRTVLPYDQASKEDTRILNQLRE